MNNLRILNRVIEWTEEGIRYDADQRHAEIMVRDMGLNVTSKSHTTPGTNEKGKEVKDERLSPEMTSRYRAWVARANYLSQDRSDIAYATKELTRRMSDP